MSKTRNSGGDKLPESETHDGTPWDVLYGGNTGERPSAPAPYQPRFKRKPFVPPPFPSASLPDTQPDSEEQTEPARRIYAPELAWLEDQEAMNEATGEDTGISGASEEEVAASKAALTPETWGKRVRAHPTERERDALGHFLPVHQVEVAPALRPINARVDDPTSLIRYAGMDGDTLPKIWLQQPGEPLLWFNRFVLYRNQGVRRTLREAMNQDRERQGKEPADATAGGLASWRPLIRRWRWQDRAIAFDLWMAGERNRQGEPIRDEASLARRDSLDNMLRTIEKGIGKAQIEKLDVDEARKMMPTLVGLYKAVMEMHRNEYKEFGAEIDRNRKRVEKSNTVAAQSNMTVNINAESFTRQIQEQGESAVIEVQGRVIGAVDDQAQD
jgi:hypothetical protein